MGEGRRNGGSEANRKAGVFWNGVFRRRMMCVLCRYFLAEAIHGRDAHATSFHGRSRWITAEEGVETGLGEMVVVGEGALNASVQHHLE